MIGPAGQCGLQGRFPGGLALAGQRKHQVDVDVIEALFTQKRTGRGDIVGLVLAPEQEEHFRVERLRAEADSRDTGCAPGGGFLRRDGRRIYFEREFAPAALDRKLARQFGEKLGGKNRGCAAAEINRLRCEDKFLPGALPFGPQRGDEFALLRHPALVNVKCAIGAYLRAKGHVEVEMADHRIHFDRITSINKMGAKDEPLSQSC